MNVIDRVKEPSTWAGLGWVFSGISTLIASKGTDGAGWAQLAAGLGAVFMREGR